MSGKEYIGYATKTEIPTREGFIFQIPYDEDRYSIALKNQELDAVLKEGFTTILRDRTLCEFSHYIYLPDDLPLFIGAREIKATSSKAGYHDIAMTLGVVTMSSSGSMHKVECSRRGWDGDWSFMEITREPPLKELEHVH